MIRKQRANNIDVKKINKSAIFRAIFENEILSNQDIATMLSISVPTVLQNVKELLEAGLVQEVGEFQSTGGRKAKAIAPIPNAKMAIGIDITQNHVGIVIVNLAGQVLNHKRMYVPFSCTQEYFYNLGEMLVDFIEQEHAQKENILGVGLSIPGIIDQTKTQINYSHILGLSNMPCSKFSEYIPYPCTFINDANAAGFAELRNRYTIHNAIYLSLSNSVGGAILLGDNLYLGENQRSGEFGHNAVVPNGKPCYCGKNGCLDAYCSAKVLTKHTDGKVAVFFEKLEEKDVFCQRIWNEYLDYLAVAVNNLRMTFDCDIIVGGYIGGYLDDYLESLRKRLALLNTFEQDGTYLQVCQYKLEASATGAALQFIDAFVDNL
ncbi:ROK family transcriptional regulator [Oscillospiraceae bacterium PP1C4]